MIVLRRAIKYDTGLIDDQRQAWSRGLSARAWWINPFRVFALSCAIQRWPTSEILEVGVVLLGLFLCIRGSASVVLGIRVEALRIPGEADGR